MYLFRSMKGSVLIHLSNKETLSGLGTSTIIELADDIHRSSVRRPGAKGGTVGNQTGAHRSVGVNMVKRSRHDHHLPT
ncbi:MAG: hypothetical protein OJF50_005125 [Nitrospira sp.]|nr:hypothetical protein [Nitrospira sp.]